STPLTERPMLPECWQKIVPLFSADGRKQRKVRHHRASLQVESMEERLVPNASPLDPTFGTGGLVRGTFQGFSNTGGTSEVILSNRQVLVAGNADGNQAVARFNADGTLDTTFGQNGIAAFHPGAINSAANAIAVQADGKILVVGNSSFAT